MRKSRPNAFMRPRRRNNASARPPSAPGWNAPRAGSPSATPNPRRNPRHPGHKQIWRQPPQAVQADQQYRSAAQSTQAHPAQPTPSKKKKPQPPSKPLSTFRKRQTQTPPSNAHRKPAHQFHRQPHLQRSARVPGTKAVGSQIERRNKPREGESRTVQDGSTHG